MITVFFLYKKFLFCLPVREAVAPSFFPSPILGKNPMPLKHLCNGKRTDLREYVTNPPQLPLTSTTTVSAPPNPLSDVYGVLFQECHAGWPQPCEEQRQWFLILHDVKDPLLTPMITLFTEIKVFQRFSPLNGSSTGNAPEENQKLAVHNGR